MTDEPALPPLPDPIRQVVYNESKGYAFSAYTADQMRAYARAAQAQPAASGEPVAWTYTGIKADGSEHGPHLVWNPAYMDAMSASKGAQATPLYAAPQPAPAPADIAASGEPVAWAFQHADGRVTYHSALEYPIAYRDTCIDKWPLYAAPQPAPVGWTDADADAARLALELECLLTDRDMPMPAISRWWDSAHEALQLHRERMAAARAAPDAQKGAA